MKEKKIESEENTSEENVMKKISSIKLEEAEIANEEENVQNIIYHYIKSKAIRTKKRRH